MGSPMFVEVMVTSLNVRGQEHRVQMTDPIAIAALSAVACRISW
jgi:hypothetical protein